MNNKVLTVTFDDKPIGIDSKENVHKFGKLHRAFSVFIFNSKNQILLQKRAESKYHSGGLWSNACCSHPITEYIVFEAENRLEEELGFSCKLEEKLSFVYYSELDNQNVEFEFDHVLVGNSNIKIEKIKFNKVEASEVRWVDIDWLKNDISANPSNYTKWFIIGLSLLNKDLY